MQHLHFSEKLDSRMKMEAGRLPTLTLEEPGQEPPRTLSVLYPVLVNLGCYQFELGGFHNKNLFLTGDLIV